jgi:hypothetical protein
VQFWRRWFLLLPKSEMRWFAVMRVQFLGREGMKERWQDGVTAVSGKRIIQWCAILDSGQSRGQPDEGNSPFVLTRDLIESNSFPPNNLHYRYSFSFLMLLSLLLAS